MPTTSPLTCLIKAQHLKLWTQTHFSTFTYVSIHILTDNHIMLRYVDSTKYDDTNKDYI